MVMNPRMLRVAEATSTTRIRTVVVDDSPSMLKRLARILKAAGNFDLVGTATNGWQALRQVSALSPELVLIDFRLPHLNGIQATQYIKQREYPPVVILVTSDDSAFARSMAEMAGADGFIRKEGNLRHRLIGALQDIFRPSGERRMGANCNSFPNRLSAHQKSGR